MFFLNLLTTCTNNKICGTAHFPHFVKDKQLPKTTLTVFMTTHFITAYIHNFFYFT